jgi:hypothetical protein
MSTWRIVFLVIGAVLAFNGAFAAICTLGSWHAQRRAEQARDRRILRRLNRELERDLRAKR